ncbi:MAG: tryptophan synthase subunit alpha [Acetobacterales bacterium]
MSGGRISARFAALYEEGRGGLVTFFTAGDPDHATSLAILQAAAANGADMIEVGMPFTDPMADGPAIQLSSQRALKAGATMARTLDLVRAFREGDPDTPVVAMGYYNPIYRYGGEAFARDAAAAGIDGVIVVDLPPEEHDELRGHLREAGLDLIMLATPTSNDARLPRIVEHASGFVYYVAILGITGTRSAAADAVREAVARLRRHTDLPVGVGFGIRTAEQAAETVRVADAAVVGSALVQAIADGLDAQGRPKAGLAGEIGARVAAFAAGVRGARATQPAGTDA